MDENTFSKTLCMTELQIQRLCYRNSHYYDAGSGKVNSSFGFLIKGCMTLNTTGRSVELGEGSLYYIPEGIRYNSVWRGNPDVEYYNLNIISKRPDGSSPRYAMAYIPELSTPETGRRIAEIYSLFATGERISKIRAIGLYYAFFADVLPYLQPESPASFNPALLSAIEFTERNFDRDFGIGELAAYCCVSESNLYRLIKAELGTSPVRYRNELRVEHAAAMLHSGALSSNEIAEKCGFNSPSYFREVFRSVTGFSPAEYRKTILPEKAKSGV